MKPNRSVFTVLLLLSAAVFQLPAQQNEADRKLLSDIRVKAEQGDAESQFALGAAFGFGNLGVPKNYAEAVKWWRKAAERNHAKAQYNLGLCYDKGEGVTKNYAEAVKWYRKAAEQNLAPAQFSLGVSYDKGEGVTKNYAEAVQMVSQSRRAE